MITIEQIRCIHGTVIEDPGSPARCCEKCAWDIVDEVELCDTCVFLSKSIFVDDPKRWCARWAMYISTEGRTRAISCSDYELRD